MQHINDISGGYRGPIFYGAAGDLVDMLLGYIGENTTEDIDDLLAWVSREGKYIKEINKGLDKSGTLSF